MLTFKINFPIFSPFSEDFGFEDNIIWTKPCVVKDVRLDSPADRSHLEPGDLIIFIGNKNIVNSSKAEIMEMIGRSQMVRIGLKSSDLVLIS